MKRKIFALLFLLTLSFSIGLAQPSNVGFERYALKQGLSHTTVYNIIQDSLGYIWFGTKEGLNQFDGYTFKISEYDLNDSTTLSATSINALLLDSKGRFWVGTNAGLNIFDRVSKKAQRIPYGVYDGTGTSNGTIWSLAEDKNGNILIATNKGLNLWNEQKQIFETKVSEKLWSGKIYQIKIGKDERIWLGTAGNGFQIFSPKNKSVKTYNTKNGLADNEVRGILCDSKGRIWISSSKALHRFNEEDNKFEYYSQRNNKIASGNTNYLLEDKDGFIWVGTWGAGISLYLENEDRFHTYKKNQRNAHSLSDNFVNSIFEDNEGAIWVATSGGVSRYDKNRKNFVNYRHEIGVPKSLSSNIINNIIRDSQGQLWVATKTGGINLWDEKNKGFQHFTKQKRTVHGLLNNRVNRISESPEGNLWLATSKGVSVFNPKTTKFKNYKPNDKVFLSATYIQTVLCDKAGGKWIGTVSGLDRYIGDKSPYFEPVTLLKNKKGGRDKFLINNLIEDKNGKIWIGTFGRGLLHFDPKTGNTRSYKYNDKKNSISNNHVYFIHLEQDIVWIGTNGSGLDRLNTKTGEFENFNTKNGLSNNVINGIESDNNNNLWISTNKGICRLNKTTKEIKHYDAEYGLQSNLFRRRASWKDPDGRIYFGGLQGLTAFYPNEISDYPIKPVVHVQNVEIFENTDKGSQHTLINTEKTKAIKLPYYQNNFIVDFIGISYLLSERNEYKYKLVGFDKSWRMVTKRRQAEYTNVPPGSYIFQVAASNSDGIWNEDGDTVQITILPPWWETWWAILLEFTVAILLITFVIKWRTRYYKKQKEILESEVKVRTFELFESREELRAQHEELLLQKNRVERQSKQITDSINYAERMQRALLRSGDQINTFLPESFIFFKPRGIVSGDFYWSGFVGERFTIVAADCTGHGVPGAILSVLGIAFFNEISAMNRDLEAGEVLDILRDRIKRIFKGSNTSHIVSDGMDLALCMFNKDKTEIQYAGAYNPLIQIRDGELTKTKADVMPIGYYVREQPRFTTHTIPIKQGDCYYMFSDGFVDQFGGKRGHKYMMKNFRKLLIAIHQEPFKKQAQILEEEFATYKADTIQIDDILVVGFRIDQMRS